MDITAIAFYAIICGLLSAVAPNLGAIGFRMMVGAGVGILAAAVLPLIKSGLGLY